jgi:hypothetical protein
VRQSYPERVPDPGHGDVPLILRTATLCSLISAIMSLSSGVLYIVCFDNMRILLDPGTLSPQLPLTFVNRKRKDRISYIEILGRLGPLRSLMHLAGLVHTCLARCDNPSSGSGAQVSPAKHMPLSAHAERGPRIGITCQVVYFVLVLWRGWVQTAHCTETCGHDESCSDSVNLHGFICLCRKNSL